MNRNRFTQMRSMDRSQEPGLHQILQPSGANQAQQSVRRKTTYTRTELLLRGLPTTQNPRRSPRTRGNTTQPPAGPQTPLPTPPVGQGIMANTASQRQRSYLPRVTKLYQMAGDKSPNRTPNRDIKPEPVVQIKTTPRVPHTPHASDCSLPGPGHRTVRPEGCGIPVLDRSRNRERCLEREPRERDCKERNDLVISDTSRSSSPTERQKMKMAKAIRLPGDQHQNKSFVYLCKPVKKVKELLTARRLRHSCEHLELAGFGEEKVEPPHLQKTNSEALLHSKAVEQGLELSSITEMSVTSTSSSASQLQLPMQHRQLLQQKLEDQAMGCNQERLESQLSEVRQRQRYLCQKEQRSKEMDLVCQNLPTLQHEIRLLQELSEKLETTLRVSNGSKQRLGSGNSGDLERQSSTVFYTPRTGPALYAELPLVRLGYLRKEQLAKITRRVRSSLTVLSVGVIREFRIETKTLNELKASDESQCFYLPAPSSQPRQDHQALGALSLPEGNPPLQCTNFRMLRENPSVLLQQLRRGNGNGSFNLLDHDMFMFLNSLSKKSDSEGILYSRLSVGVPPKEISPGYQGYQSQELLSAKRSCTTQTEEPVSGKEKQKNLPQIDIAQAMKPKKEVRKLQQLPVLPGTTRKARIIKMSPIHSNVEPKVRMKLFKTVLVGLVQVAIFLVLIMAFIYPDVSC